MKRIFLFLLLLTSQLFALNTYGYSRVSVERTWTIGDAEGAQTYFRGAMAINDSHQKVRHIFTDPPLDYEQDEDGVIWLVYNGEPNSSDFVIKGKALVDIYYDTDITYDSPLPEQNLSFTNLTEPDSTISLQARSLADEQSSLKTILGIVNWVFKTMEYDVAYWGEIKSAKEVFQTRHGVCVEYTHLLISMLRSLGFETRYVSGYVYAGAWQPHAWTEIYVPGYGWLPADATFGQIGSLDNTHVAINYGDDQTQVYDLLITFKENATLAVDDQATMEFSSEEDDPVDISVSFDESTYVVDVMIKNNRNEYLFGNYVFLISSAYGQTQSTVILLEPYETAHMYQGLNHSIFEEQFSYSVPVIASFNDAKAEEELIIAPSEEELWDEEPANIESPPCPLTFILLLLLFFKRHRAT